MIHYILTDIEGTTTDIDFVKNTLFPYSTDNIESFILANSHNNLVINYIKDVFDTIYLEDSTLNIDIKLIISILKQWIQEDRKHPALKGLQGMIWKYGYEQDGIIAHLYQDVFPELNSWKEKKIRLGVYSSGSVEAQKLLFSHSLSGDISYLFSDFFDTSIGFKQNRDSYINIRNHIGLVPFQILFLSDVEAELDAAKLEGFKTCQLVRANTVPSKRHPTAASFLQVSKLFMKSNHKES